MSPVLDMQLRRSLIISGAAVRPAFESDTIHFTPRLWGDTKGA